MNKKFFLIFMAAATSMSFAYRIGVLKNTTSSCSEVVTIRLDTEDDDARTKITRPKNDNATVGIVRTDRASGGVTFTYCVQNVTSMPASSFDYAVLRLDSRCPTGSFAFARHHDCEDDDNNNKKSGNYSPNVIDKNATLEYCFAPASSSTKKYPFSKEYGVFAKPDPAISGVAQYSLYVDDEDDRNRYETGEEDCIVVPDYNYEFKEDGTWEEILVGSHEQCDPRYTYHNSNKWIWRTESWNVPGGTFNLIAMKAIVMNRVNKIMYGDENTTYNFVRWNGTTLKKSVAASEPVVASAAEIPAPLATNIAANIKSVTRENIGVELQTAGDVEISVVGFNGRTFASFTAKNLQPGFNSINWNSTSVPNGHYIVSVKQNGLTRGINVKLK